MKLLKNVYFIQSDENANKSIKGENGEELYLDTDFNPYTYTNKIGVIAETPKVCDHNYNLKKGDTVLIHHSVVRELNEVVLGEEKYWRCANYNIFATINNQVLKPMRDFIFVDPIEDTHTHIGDFQIKFDDKPLAQKGIISYLGEDIAKLGVLVGDEIQYTKNANYSVNVGDKELYRMRERNIRLITRNGVPVLLDDQILTKEDLVIYKADNVKNIHIGDKIGFLERVEPNVVLNGEELLSINTTDIIYTKNDEETD